MRIAALLLAAALLPSPIAYTQNNTVSTASLSAEEHAIYLDFFEHYPGRAGELLGLKAELTSFHAPDGLRRQPDIDLMQSLVPPPDRGVRTLPPDLLKFAGQDSVLARIPSKDRHVPSDPRVGPDGYVLTETTLSEIAFNPAHDHAVFVWSSRCRCLGGEGATIVYALKSGHWKRESMPAYWEG